MTGKIVTEREGSKRPKDDRNKRLAEQLRANLQRRKAQARSRREGEADSRPDGISAARKGAGEAE
jgi:hypothetical protein